MIEFSCFNLFHMGTAGLKHLLRLLATMSPEAADRLRFITALAEVYHRPLAVKTLWPATNHQQPVIHRSPPWQRPDLLIHRRSNSSNLLERRENEQITQRGADRYGNNRPSFSRKHTPEVQGAVAHADACTCAASPGGAESSRLGGLT